MRERSVAPFDQDLLLSVLSEFAHTLAGRFEVSEVLYRLTEHVTQIVQVVGAGVSLIDDNGQLRRATGINEATTRLEAVEERLQQGPCMDAFRDGVVVAVADLSGVTAWSEWSDEARRRGIEAVLGIPLWVNGEALGAMNIYSAHVRDWHPDEIRVAQVLADMAASYVSNASELERSRRTAEQLREALESRVVIEQAKGVLAAEWNVSVDDAFDVMRSHSRAHRASIRSVAEAVVNLGLRPVRRGPSRAGDEPQTQGSPGGQ